jgi:phosphate uptake regulator
MKRKIIKQGHNTLTITLPNDWAKEHNIKAGEEINVTTKDSGLFISTTNIGDKKCTNIDITEMNIPTIWKYFMAAYREGYDEIKVTFKPGDLYDYPYKYIASLIDSKDNNASKRTPTETIQDITNRFIGLEIIEHHKNYCIIRDMTEISTKEFDASFRRVFLILLQMGDEIQESICNNNSEPLQNIIDMDINVDKFHDYCVRVLNKTGFKDAKKSHLMFLTLYFLEILGDEFKHISQHICKDMTKQKLNNLSELAEMTINQFQNFYDLFYNFNKEKVITISKKDFDLYAYLPDTYHKDSGKKSKLIHMELDILNHFRTISVLINSLVEIRVEMEF